jgi:TIR domain
MQVFICWSGKASHKIAEALKTFLEDTIQDVKPFLSSESIQKGGRWLAEISGRLSECNFGILCLTKDNLDSRWLLFEAGALSKNSTDGRVSALLTGIQASDVESPLSQFQHTGADSTDVFKLLQTINTLLPEANRRTESQLKRSFEKSWPDFEKELDAAAKMKGPSPAAPARDPDSIMNETLELVRGLVRDAEAAKAVPSATLGFPYYSSVQKISPALYAALAQTGAISAPIIVTDSDQPTAGTQSRIAGSNSPPAAGALSGIMGSNVSKAPAPIKPLKGGGRS